MQLLPAEIRQEIGRHLGFGIVDFVPVAGGCINHAGRISVGDKNYFVKWNDRLQFPEMLSTEASGLQLLQSAKAIRIPQVVTCGATERFQFLVLEFLERGYPRVDYWLTFGRQLALLHRQSSAHFGLDHDNYVGSLRQNNARSIAWVDFFINNRIECQLKMAIDGGFFETSVIKKFHQLYKKLSVLLPDEKPSLLHGDLWSGNLLADETGLPCLIDPAVYYGNREIDLAMTRLFGGFDQKYLEAYDEEFPLVPGLERRYDLYNLYPLLVHTNLFGGNYPAQVVSIVNRFV